MHKSRHVRGDQSDGEATQYYGKRRKKAGEDRLLDSTMPGYPVDCVIFKNKDERYRCPKCDSLLREAVQLACGDRLCKSCADEVIAQHASPVCPKAHCGEPLDNEGGAYVSCVP